MSEDDKLYVCKEKEGGENRKREHAYISWHLIDMEQRPCEILEKNSWLRLLGDRNLI